MKVYTTILACILATTLSGCIASRTEKPAQQNERSAILKRLEKIEEQIQAIESSIEQAGFDQVLRAEEHYRAVLSEYFLQVTKAASDVFVSLEETNGNQPARIVEPENATIESPEKEFHAEPPAILGPADADGTIVETNSTPEQ